MSITNELREQLLYHTPAVDAGLTAIIDRIDAEYQKAEDEWKAKNGETWLRGYAECHAELMEGNEAIAADLEKAGWVRLPKDADGEVIHIGDVMDNTHKRGFAAKTVIGISYHEGGKICVRVDENELRWHDPLKLHHHHEPTVVEVLREMVVDWDCAPDGEDKDDVLKEYAEKLREVVEHERD